MKILMLVDQRYPTDHVFLEEVYSKIFRKRGHKINWVMKSKKFSKEIKIENWNKNKIFVLPTQKNLLADYLALMQNLKRLKNKIKNEHFDIVYVRNDPVIGLFVKKFSGERKIPFVFQLSHLKSEETIFFAKKGIYGSRIKNYFLGNISKILTNRVLKKANLIFAISDQMKAYLIKKGIKTNRIETLPLGANPYTKINKNEVKKIRFKYNLEQGKTLIYLGTLIRTRDPFFLFKVIKKLKEEIPEIKLLIVGEGKNKQDLIDYQNYVNKHFLHDNIIFTGKILRKSVPSFLAVADIGISQFPPNPILKMNSPIKLMEYMNMGLPVVANDYNPEQKKIINMSQGGFCIDYNTENFCQAISTLIKNKKMRLEMGKKGQDYIRRKRNYEKLATIAEKRMLSLIQ